VRLHRDRAEDALRLVHARAVVGLDAVRILLDELRDRELPRQDGAVDVGDSRFLERELDVTASMTFAALRHRDVRQRDGDRACERERRSTFLRHAEILP
jgi:hypothetical protein